MIPNIDENTLQAICDIIGDTETGLTGTEIGKILSQLSINDLYPSITKRNRLFEALRTKQNKDNCGNNVMNFILTTMSPVRYTNNPDLFEHRRSQLNVILAFLGYDLGQDGKLRISHKVNTITEAHRRAGHLRKKLLDRQVHPDVLRFCRVELLQDNYFHAVFEATKSVADKIRERTGLVEDGAEIVDKTFGIKLPLFAINSLRTETEQSEQKGFANLLKGLFGTFRNVTAHAPKIKWTIEEQDALDLLSLVSYIHRRLDSAVSTGFKPTP